MNVYAGVEGLELAFMGRKVAGRVVAEVDGAGAIPGELMGRGATYAYWGICTCF